MKKHTLRIFAFIMVVLACPALAADPSSVLGSKNVGQSNPGKEVAQVSADDIFGFTSQTDVGKPGDSGFANENDGRFGKRQGTYGALNTNMNLAAP